MLEEVSAWVPGALSLEELLGKPTLEALVLLMLMSVQASPTLFVASATVQWSLEHLDITRKQGSHKDTRVLEFPCGAAG